MKHQTNPHSPKTARRLDWITPAERVALFLYILDQGKLPDWVPDNAEGQTLVFATLTGMTEKQARAAFAMAQQKGYIAK